MNISSIVVTVEGDDNTDETMKLKEIQKLPHVASADFSYTYTDGDVDSTEA